MSADTPITGSIELQRAAVSKVEWDGRRIQAWQALIRLFLISVLASLAAIGRQVGLHDPKLAHAYHASHDLLLVPKALGVASVLYLVLTGLRVTALAIRWSPSGAQPPVTPLIVCISVGCLFALIFAVTLVAGPHRWWLVSLLVLAVILVLGPFAHVERKIRSKPHASGPTGGQPAASQAGNDEAVGGKTEEAGPTGGQPDGVIICCSGGGVRSAAFCLGSLQKLMDLNVLQRSKAVVAVSGGGYLAAAMATLNTHPETTNTEPGAADTTTQPTVFGPGSPEARYVLAHSAELRTRRAAAVASWALGAGVNVLLLASALRVVTLIAGWLAVASGLVGTDSTRWTFRAPSALEMMWWEIPAAAGVFVAGAHTLTGQLWFRTWLQRWDRRAPEPLRAYWRTLGPELVVTALAGWVLLLLVPYLVVEIQRVWGPSPIGGQSLLSGLGFPVGASAKSLSSRPTGQPSASFAVALFRGSTLGVLAMLASAAWGAWSKLQASQAGPNVDRLIVRFRRAIGAAAALAAATAGVSLLLIIWTAQVIAAPDAALRLSGSPQYPSILGSPALPVALLVLCRLIPAADVSLFPFYRNELAGTYLLKRKKTVAEAPPGDRQKVVPLLRRNWPRMSMIGPVVGSGNEPELVLCATANLQDQGLLPQGRDAALFTFSRTKTGLSSPHLPGAPGEAQPSTTAYERLAPVTIADAMALTGAAVSPIIGRESPNVAPFRYLLALANVRTGAWFPNPYWASSDESGLGHNVKETEEKSRQKAKSHTAVPDRLVHGRGAEPGSKLATAAMWFCRILDRPSAYSVLAEAFGPPSLYRPALYLTDGGQFDNLGLVQAVRMRARIIVVLDASADPEDGFATIAAAIATLRMDGIAEISGFDPSLMTRGQAKHPRRCWAEATIKYKTRSDQGHEPCTGTLIYIKSLFTGGLSWDVQAYKIAHPSFPFTPTQDQFFNEFDFEAYRQLGWQLTTQTQRSGCLDRALT
jgi:hypothetical protein